MLNNALRDVANWRTKRQSSYTKSQVLAWMIIISRKRNLIQLANCQKYAHKIVLKCLYLARIGGLWSVNKLARSITQWTQACVKRLNRLISYIHHTCEYKQYWFVGNTAKQCRLGLFQDSDFCGRSWGLNIYFGWNIVRFWKSYTCSNKLDV